jgi:hypothetical protein
VVGPGIPNQLIVSAAQRKGSGARPASFDPASLSAVMKCQKNGIIDNYEKSLSPEWGGAIV